MERLTHKSDGYFAVSSSNCYEDQNEEYCGPAIERLAAYEDAEQARLENPPLTLEQLKQMDGKPVYIIHPYDHRYDHWQVVVIKVKFFPDKEWNFKDYGRLWFAYRSEPNLSGK
ncbi:MAG TPA: hypothetical protein VHO94_04110 [Oscillospiraceae bacterium]|nr:hypothetical protein [Oscillospiraceae bacterium]